MGKRKVVPFLIVLLAMSLSSHTAIGYISVTDLPAVFDPVEGMETIPEPATVLIWV